MPDGGLFRVLLIENSGADFYKSRLNLALFLLNAGYEVSALVPDDGYVKRIENQGVKVFHYPMERSNKGIIQLVSLIWMYRRIIREGGFDIIHSFRFQPNLVASLASLFSGVRLILHVTGLGVAYANNSIKYRLLRFVSQGLYFLKFLICDVLVVQNPDDIRSLWFTRLNARKVKLILGSGINLDNFTPNTEGGLKLRDSFGLSSKDILFICVTRLLWEKGIAELVAAFEELNAKNPKIKLYVVGWSDQDNPRHIPAEFTERFKDPQRILFTGPRSDVNAFLSAADVFIYPSYYREGIPRALLEALAMELPVITTDAPGCRLAVNGQRNGLLITPRSKKAIINAVKQIIGLSSQYDEMGQASRSLAVERFSSELVYGQILSVYQEVLGGRAVRIKKDVMDIG
jgi:glycosyltransferase involved in cell wall biosynthesis